MPFCGSDACGDDVVEEANEEFIFCALFCAVEPLEELCWDGVWACGFSVFYFLQDEVKLL